MEGGIGGHNAASRLEIFSGPRIKPAPYDRRGIGHSLMVGGAFTALAPRSPHDDRGLEILARHDHRAIVRPIEATDELQQVVLER